MKIFFLWYRNDLYLCGIFYLIFIHKSIWFFFVGLLLWTQFPLLRLCLSKFILLWDNTSESENVLRTRLDVLIDFKGFDGFENNKLGLNKPYCCLQGDCQCINTIIFLIHVYDQCAKCFTIVFVLSSLKMGFHAMLYIKWSCNYRKCAALFTTPMQWGQSKS